MLLDHKHDEIFCGRHAPKLFHLRHSPVGDGRPSMVTEKVILNSKPNPEPLRAVEQKIESFVQPLLIPEISSLVVVWSSRWSQLKI